MATVTIIKGTSMFQELDVGAHYYAFSPVTANYQEAFANIKLPTGFKNTPTTGSPTNYTRNGYISLGIQGSVRGIDLGLCRDSNTTWHPYYYDIYGGTFKPYPAYAAPSNATNAIIVVKPVDTTHVKMYIQFTDASGANVGTAFDQAITVKSGNLTMSGGNVSCRFYRFASLVPTVKNTNNMDSTYMIGAQFTNLLMYNRQSKAYESWGMGTSLVQNAWKIYAPRMGLAYSGNTDTFDIDHWYA